MSTLSSSTSIASASSGGSGSASQIDSLNKQIVQLQNQLKA
ncbi:FlxA-like family protein [Erwinia tracheiphila]|nr:FlxA-like family protein [Erwinia tracheiphila]UIA84625.1 FlxA-like family protein [Erwinia tracheiphila]UIA86996.1 FlxA-like family protein [Erwinia tracheiphila]UIA93217.1 FlxA-like family protein [Erwinia tracheiphila]UIA95353.1 FlxA-like family protein [Erwinia tracheiphila]